MSSRPMNLVACESQMSCRARVPGCLLKRSLHNLGSAEGTDEKGFMKVLFLAVLMAFYPGSVRAQEPTTSLERFRLFNACRPMALVIESMSEGAAAIGLTKELLQAAAESRLRAARLYTEDLSSRSDYSYLYVNVNVVGPASSISVEYKKEVVDMFGKSGIATTWDTGSAGTARNSGVILSYFSQHLDQFLAAYLRVNEEDCRQQ